MYAEGEGVPRDDVQALMWFILAAEQNQDAIENRNNAVSSMTAAQIAAAKKLARVEAWITFASRAVITSFRAAEGGF